MTDTVQDIGPLDWRVSITDSQGRPSPEFQRRWNGNRGNTSLIKPVNFGSGAPTATSTIDGETYIDLSSNPYKPYYGYAGTFHLAVPVSADPTGVASNVATVGTSTSFMRADATPAIQLGSATQFGLFKNDGLTITSSSGILSVPVATTSAAGIVKPDGSTVKVTAGTISVPTATTAALGLVKPDGTTITITAGGVISAVAGGSLTIQSSGTSLGTATTMNFTGAGVTTSVSAGVATVTISGGGGGGGFTLQSNGSALGTATTLNITGSGVTTSFSSGTGTLSITGGGGGSGSVAYGSTWPPNNNGSFGSGLMMYAGAYVPAGVVLSSINVDMVSAATGTWYGAIYADNGAGVPGTRLAVSAAQTNVVAGTNSAAISYTSTGQYLWFAAAFQMSISYYYSGYGVGYYSTGVVTAPPTTAPSPTANTGVNFSVFAVGSAGSSGASVAAPLTIADLVYCWDSAALGAKATGTSIERLANACPWNHAYNYAASAAPPGAVLGSASLNGYPAISLPGNSGGRFKYYGVNGNSGITLHNATFFALVRATTFSGSPDIFCGPIGALEFRFESTGAVGMNKSYTVALGNSTTTVALNTWTQFNSTYNDSTGAMAFRVNKTAAGSSTNAQTITYPTTGLFFNEQAGSGDFAGDIVFMAVYNRVLSLAEITAVENYLTATYGV